jgi:integrase
MDRRAWVNQLKRHVDKLGVKKAPWQVFWNDPETGSQRSKSCGSGPKGKKAANELADLIHSQLVTGTYKSNAKEHWDTFRVRLDEHINGRYDVESRNSAKLSLDTFARVAKPHRMASVNSDLVDRFISARLAEDTKRKGPGGKSKKVSPATVNRELRYLKMALRLAKDWKYITEVPRIRFLKTLQKQPTFVPADHFTAIYKACSVATMPAEIPNVSPADWWRGLTVFLYMTGWRIGQTLALRWDDVDLDNGTALTKAADNKGGRDQVTRLHSLAVDHLRPLVASFDATVFPWVNHQRVLWDEFGRIQEAARLADGSPMPKAGKAEAWYGFHDLRRGFATANAESVDLFELQDLMQHRSLETTRGYVSMAKRVNRAADVLFVPTLPKVAESG